MKQEPWLPPAWYAFTGLLLVTGILMLPASQPLLPQVAGLAPQVRPDRLYAFVGIMLISLSLSDWITFLAMRGLTKLFGLRGETSVQDLWPSTWVGFTEGVLFPVALITDNAQFIGLWLAVKVAGQWVRWGTEFPPPESNANMNRDLVEEAKKGRRRFNKFLVGTGLRIILAGFTYVILRGATFSIAG